MAAKDGYAVAVKRMHRYRWNGHRTLQYVPRKERLYCIVLLTLLSGYLENRAARSVLAFFCSKIHRVSVRVVDAL